MRIQFTKAAKIFGAGLLALSLFAGGYVAGQAKFGQPKTVLHVVEIQWRPGVPQMEKDAAVAGIKDMASKMPGVKNIWIKWDRLEPRDFSAAFAIEFRSREAADAYAESPLHDAWEKEYVPLRAASISIQVTNP
jgi:Stress responsive A/B Barrel Domain